MHDLTSAHDAAAVQIEPLTADHLRRRLAAHLQRAFPPSELGKQESIEPPPGDRPADLDIARALVERDQITHELAEVIAARGRIVQRLLLVMAEQSQAQERLGQELAERDGLVEHSHRTLAERDDLIEHLHRTLAERDGSIQDLQRILQELRQDLARRDGALQELRQVLAQRDSALEETPRSSGRGSVDAEHADAPASRSSFVEIPAEASIDDLSEGYAALNAYLNRPGRDSEQHEEDEFYLAIELVLRGSEELIKRRQADYLPYLDLPAALSTLPILDVGCGRGEFLELVRERDHPCLGIDLNAMAIDHVRRRGLEARQIGAVEFLEQRADASFAAITAFQVVEHLAPDYLHRLVKLAYTKLAPGGKLLLETVNPYCIETFRSYYLDPTHMNPIPKDLLLVLLKYCGFVSVRSFYQSPLGERDGSDSADVVLRYQTYALLATK